jgi:hypothetical protein
MRQEVHAFLTAICGESYELKVDSGRWTIDIGQWKGEAPVQDALHVTDQQRTRSDSLTECQCLVWGRDIATTGPFEEAATSSNNCIFTTTRYEVPTAR